MSDPYDPLSNQEPAGSLDESTIANLVRESGGRSDVPELRAARVRKAVHGAWASEMRRRSRRRMIYAGLAAAATLAVLVWVSGLTPWSGRTGTAAGPVGRVALESGSSTLTTGSGAAVAANVGDEIPAGSLIETSAGAWISLTLADGRSARLDENTTLRVLSASRVALERGAVYLDSGTNGASAPVRVQTALGEVYEIGTRFEVRRTEDALQVRVREGRVGVDVGGRVHEAAAGAQLRIDRDGAVDRQSIDPFGPEWGWVLRAAAAPEIDERPLAELLDWAERETGHPVEFASPRLADEAPAIVMRGSVAGLGPEEALDAVLPICGLRVRHEGSRVLVDRAESILAE